MEIGEVPPGEELRTLEVVVDRLVLQEKARVRLADSLETALRLGGGVVHLLLQPPSQRDREEWQEWVRSNRLFSPHTGKAFERLEARHFSFNSLSGACDHCHGLGQQMEFDPELMVPDTKKSLQQGALLPLKKVPKAQIPFYDQMLKDLGRSFRSVHRSAL